VATHPAPGRSTYRQLQVVIREAFPRFARYCAGAFLTIFVLEAACVAAGLAALSALPEPWRTAAEVTFVRAYVVPASIPPWQWVAALASLSVVAFYFFAYFADHARRNGRWKRMATRRVLAFYAWWQCLLLSYVFVWLMAITARVASITDLARIIPGRIAPWIP